MPTWVSLLGLKPLAGASTRPREVSVSGVPSVLSRNCRGTAHSRPQGWLPLAGDRGQGAAGTHREPAERLQQHRVQGGVGRHVGRHPHHVPTRAGKRGVTAQHLSCRHPDEEPPCHLLFAGAGSAQHQRVLVHPVGIKLGSGTQRHLPRGYGAQRGPHGLLLCAVSRSRTSARKVLAGVPTALMAMGLKGWPGSGVHGVTLGAVGALGARGSMHSRVTLGLPCAVLQDTVTSATRVPGAAYSLRVTTRGRLGRAGGTPWGPTPCHVAATLGDQGLLPGTPTGTVALPFSPVGLTNIPGKSQVSPSLLGTSRHHPGEPFGTPRWHPKDVPKAPQRRPNL